MGRRLRIGISTCPNDTFAFHGLLDGTVDTRGLDLKIALRDVQELNEGLASGVFDAAKASFHAALHLASTHGVLPVGSALGFGVGPVLLAARPGLTPAATRPDGGPLRVLCPGAWTTATLLYGLFHPGAGDVRQVIFSEIMPALLRGDADMGVCIHEGRFTWEARGLHLVEDLGATWEGATGVPLPLGGILARHDLGSDVHAALTAAIRDSLDAARAAPDATLPTLRRHAQELDDDAIRAHVGLYVNERTRDLGDVGRTALAELSRRAREASLAGTGELRVLEA